MAHSTTPAIDRKEAEPVLPDASTAAEVRDAYERLRKGFEQQRYPTYEERLALLDKLHEVVLRRREEIAEAAREDWGHRCRVDSLLGDVFPTVSSIRYVRRHLRDWMKPERRRVALIYRPGQNKVHAQPCGVVGIISPWNYPFQLAVEPLVYAIAAGNRVLVKPSELTPKTAELIKAVVAEVFKPDQVAVVTGAADVAQAVSALPLDHLLFTGSTRVGKLIMRAAAENLVPVTLELGGKSPALVHPDYPVEKAAARVVAGKFFNAGQTCIAVDYLLVPRGQVDAYAKAIEAEVRRCYPTIKDNKDLSAIASVPHYRRLRGLLDSAVKAGAKAVEIKPAGEELGEAGRKLAPTLLLDVSDDMPAMQEEIFGPILPIVPYDTVDAAIGYINARPRPLAFYYFDEDRGRADQVLRSTTSGGACINECLVHFIQDDMPFGGVGPSGMGAYHGKEGFDTFSHKRAVFYQSKFNLAAGQAPPYGARMERILSFLLGR